MRGAWAYQLEPLDRRRRSRDSPNRNRRGRSRSTLTSAAAGDDQRVRTADDGSVLFDPASTDVARLAKLMMFYEALGGAAYAATPHRYQAFIDLSRPAQRRCRDPVSPRPPTPARSG